LLPSFCYFRELLARSGSNSKIASGDSRFPQSIVSIGPDGEQIVLDEDPPNVGDE